VHQKNGLDQNVHRHLTDLTVNGRLMTKLFHHQFIFW